MLRGADVVILPDNDGPGREHRDIVGKALVGIAASVKVLELPGLPEKGDVSDWLQAGGTADELRCLAVSAPAWTPRSMPPAGGPRSRPRVRSPTCGRRSASEFESLSVQKR